MAVLCSCVDEGTSKTTQYYVSLVSQAGCSILVYLKAVTKYYKSGPFMHRVEEHIRPKNVGIECYERTTPLSNKYAMTNGYLTW
ncbi:hypothetical protein GCM10025859_42450 [Alicyclobacillus fastidiosus]|nr:hypothetical protein GCM10025859_42450 [Alicyclobacillus fastidiosus]